MTRRKTRPNAFLSTSTGSTVREVVVTPELAKKWLSPDVAAPNRSLSEGTVATYAFSLVEGRWGSCMVMFDRKGKMRDGQHHLEAIVRTGKSARMLLHENCSEEDLAHVDMGRPRSTADSLRIATGDPFMSIKVAVARSAVIIGAQTDNRVSPDLIKIYLDALGKPHMDAICEHRSKLPASWRLALVYTRPLNPALTDEIFAKIIDSDAVFTDGDHHAERSTTMSALLRTRSKNINYIKVIHIVLRAIQAIHEGTALKHLTEESSGLAWANQARSAKGLPTVFDMFPKTYPKRRRERVRAKKKGQVAVIAKARSSRSKPRPAVSATA